MDIEALINDDPAAILLFIAEAQEHLTASIEAMTASKSNPKAEVLALCALLSTTVSMLHFMAQDHKAVLQLLNMLVAQYEMLGGDVSTH